MQIMILGLDFGFDKINNNKSTTRFFSNGHGDRGCDGYRNGGECFVQRFVDGAIAKKNSETANHALNTF